MTNLTGESVQVHARLSPRAAAILRHHRRILNVSTDCEILEISLGLLEVCSVEANVERARTQLWNALRREAATANIREIQSYMAKFKRKRGRRKQSLSTAIK